MEKNGRPIPIQTLQDFIRNGETFPASSGSSATRYYTTITRSGELYNLKVLYHSTTNQIYQCKKGYGKITRNKKIRVYKDDRKRMPLVFNKWTSKRFI